MSRPTRYPFEEMTEGDQLLLPFSQELRRSVIAAAWNRGFRVRTRALPQREGRRMMLVNILPAKPKEPVAPD